MKSFSRNAKNFFNNVSITGLLWFVYNTVLFILYFIYCSYRSNAGYIGRGIVDLDSYKVNIIFSVVISIFLILLLITSFFIGRKLLVKCSNPILTFISCFSLHSIIWIRMWKSNILIEFTQSYLAIVLPGIFANMSDFSPPLNDPEYMIWSDEWMSRVACFGELVTSPNMNALFALLPFAVAFIGLYVRKR